VAVAADPADQGPSGTGTRLAPDERRRQILAAARSLFNERHYGAVSTADIAAEAGIARGLINHYFGTKRDLYVEVVRQMVRVPPPPVPEYVQGTTPEERLAESIDDWLEMVWRNRETWLAALQAQGLGDPEIGAIFEEAREDAASRMIAVLGLGPTAEASPELRGVLRAYGGMAEAATVQWLQHGRFSREQVAALLNDSVPRLVGPALDQILQNGNGNRASARTNGPKEKAKR
jgi:AcrR family transcriptional regulator